MFRDTFAVEMLLAGVPIDQVSLLLGHASVKVTEKSYSPFVKARQIQLQDSVRNAWGIGTEPLPPTAKGYIPPIAPIFRSSGLHPSIIGLGGDSFGETTSGIRDSQSHGEIRQNSFSRF